MTESMTVTALPDGARLRLDDGPLSLIIGVDGSPGAVAAGHRAAILRFKTVSDEIADELALLRVPAEHRRTDLTGSIARRAWRAVRPFAADHFITPLAALKGAIAEEILAAAMASADTDRIFVNCRGHLALHLTPGFGFRAGIVDGPDFDALYAAVELRAPDPIRGIGVSGRAGGGPSLGVADAVTVLAQTSAKADAAATLIANAVDLPDHPNVERRPASAIRSDHFLGERLVVTSAEGIDTTAALGALARGKWLADSMLERGLITSACLRFGGSTAISGPLTPVPFADMTPEPRRAGLR